MRVIITGASGFVGQLLVPKLQNMGLNLLLIGRSQEQLELLYPTCESASYDDLPSMSQGAELLINLAVVNNNADHHIDIFKQVNVDLPLTLTKIAKDSGIKKFVNFSSFHVFDQIWDDPYAMSKRQAASALEETTGIETLTLYLPIIYGDKFSGKLKQLNYFPKWATKIVFPALSAFKPTVHVDTIVQWIKQGANVGNDGYKLLYDDQSRNLVYLGMNRVIDLLFSVIILVLFWWLLLIVWALVKFTSPGPGIFCQERVGRGGKSFICYKFRTMANGTKQAGTHEVTASSVTALGNILRKTKIDELPQILNIFKNEVSLIGPRPCLPSQKELVNERELRGVFDMKPGISGLAQINGIDMSKPKILAECDARYKGMRSILLNIKIAISTALGSGSGDRVQEIEETKP